MNLYLAQLMVNSRPVEVYPLLSVSFERAIRRMLFSRDTIDRITKWAGQAFSAAASDDSWPFIGVTRYGVDEDTLKQHIKANIDGDYLISEMLDFTGMDEFFFKVNTLELYQTNYCTVITKLLADRITPSNPEKHPDIPASIEHQIVNKAYIEHKKN